MSNVLKHYFGQAKMGWKVGLRYRFNFFIAMAMTPLTLIIFYFLWKSIYSYTGQEIIRGFTFSAMVQYYVLSMIIGFFIWCDIDKWISQDVRRGHVISFFVYPMNFLWQYLAFEIGMNGLGLILETIPVFIIGFVFFGLELAPLFYIIMFIISVILAFFLTFFISFNVGLSAFWLKKIDGIRKIRRTLLLFLSGGMIPLTFFPESVQTILHYLPFEYIRFVPINIYLTNYSIIGVFIQIGIQITWIVALYLLSVFIYKRAFKQFAGAGV